MSAVLATVQVTKDEQGGFNANFATNGGISQEEEVSIREVLVQMCEELNVRIMARAVQMAYQKGYRAAEEAMDE